MSAWLSGRPCSLHVGNKVLLCNSAKNLNLGPSEQDTEHQLALSVWYQSEMDL
jgi:hypothetical protein